MQVVGLDLCSFLTTQINSAVILRGDSVDAHSRVESPVINSVALIQHNGPSDNSMSSDKMICQTAEIPPERN